MCDSGTVCQNFTVTFEPANISSIARSANVTVLVNVTVPSGFVEGNYTGLINITSNGTTQAVGILIGVPANRTWAASPTSCQRTQNPAEGTACEVAISNTGNAAINFTISVVIDNYTSAN